MANAPADQVTTAGTNAAVHNATFPGEDTVPPDCILRVHNGTGGSITLTVVTPGTVDGLAITDRTLAVPASGDRYLRLPRALYRDPDDGLVHLTWSATGATFEVIR